MAPSPSVTQAMPQDGIGARLRSLASENGVIGRRAQMPIGLAL
jgi:hypothetical protein